MKQTFITLVLIVFCGIASAQTDDAFDIQRGADGAIRFARFSEAGQSLTVQNDTVLLKSVLSATVNDRFIKLKENTDERGITHKRFQYYYKGVKVEDAQYLTHSRNGNIEYINGDFPSISLPSVTHSLSEQQALAYALNYVKSRKYKWEDSGAEMFIKQIRNNESATYYPAGELVISKDYLSGTGTHRLSWKFTISSMIPENEQLIYVDANNGTVINDVPLIWDANVTCTAQTLFSSTQTVIGDTYSGSVRLRETRNGVSIQTLNAHNLSSLSTVTDFTNSSTNWTSGSWGAFNQDKQALDVHWGTEKVLDFWRTVFNRNSIDGNGLRVISYVHYNSNPSRFPTGEPNAYWNGTGKYMLYGDGDGYTFKPLVALDICAHELGHGIFQHVVGNSSSTEIRALNEGFSDIWGACVEDWVGLGKQKWLIGEELYKTPTLTCLRNLQNPKSTTAWEGQHPDTYHGNYWSADEEPHCNSTVLSHWFYLLTEGGSGTNDLGNSYSVSGIGITKARDIAFAGECDLFPTAQYADARLATIQAAINLFGSNSPEVIATTNAWYAVGVGELYACNTIYINSQTYGTGTYNVTGCKIEIANSVIQSAATVNIHAGEEVTLKPGFAALSGSNVSITVDRPSSGLLSASASADLLSATVSPDASIVSSLEEAVATQLPSEKFDFTVFPNPSDGNFTVALSGEIEPYTVEIYNTSGILLGKTSCDTGAVNIHRSDLRKGIYYVRLLMGKEVATKKLIVK